MKKSLATVLERAGAYFMKRSPIHLAAPRISDTFQEMKIPFAVAGALAANAHGHVRTTEDVAVLISPKNLQKFKEAWLGRGWVEKFPGSKGVRDAVHHINIDVLLTGDFPGDGKPKPVMFPDPSAVSEVDSDGIPIIKLSTLIELKLASGMTAPDRPRDLDDVIQLVRINELPRSYGEELNPYVQPKFDELWLASERRDEY